MTARTLEEIETPAGPAPRITLEELEGRTTYRTPGPWRVTPTSDYPPGEKPGINIDAGEHGLGGFVCEVCGPNPDERMRADAYFIAHAPDIFAIAQEQRAEIARLKRAIIAANRGVIAGEGVGLAYYMENCYGVEDSPAESVEVIHQVTGE